MEGTNRRGRKKAFLIAWQRQEQKFFFALPGISESQPPDRLRKWLERFEITGERGLEEQTVARPCISRKSMAEALRSRILAHCGRSTPTWGPKKPEKRRWRLHIPTWRWPARSTIGDLLRARRPGASQTRAPPHSCRMKTRCATRRDPTMSGVADFKGWFPSVPTASAAIR